MSALVRSEKGQGEHERLHESGPMPSPPWRGHLGICTVCVVLLVLALVSVPRDPSRPHAEQVNALQACRRSAECCSGWRTCRVACAATGSADMASSHFRQAATASGICSKYASRPARPGRPSAAGGRSRGSCSMRPTRARRPRRPAGTLRPRGAESPTVAVGLAAAPQLAQSLLRRASRRFVFSALATGQFAG